MKIIFSLAFIFAVAVLLAFHAQAGPLDGGFESVLDATYIIEKQEVRLIGGWAEVRAAPGSAGKIITVVFGEPVYGDLDSDGYNDAALFLARDSGGSGTFYYVAAAIAKNGIYRGTNAVFLGDRVVLWTIRIRDNVIVAWTNLWPRYLRSKKPCI